MEDHITKLHRGTQEPPGRTPPQKRASPSSQRAYQPRRSWLTAAALALGLILGSVSEVEAGINAQPHLGKLVGIGYREQELQTAKGSQFQSEEATGVREVSFNGGTQVFIKGTGLNLNPQTNLIWFASEEFDVKIPGPLLTEDDSFGSHPQLGTLAYRLPSLTELFGWSEDFFYPHDTLNFIISVTHNGISSQPIECVNTANCRVRYQRSYTPVVYHVGPRVLYDSAMAEIWFDPKSVMSLIMDLDADEKPFINAKIDESLLDFTSTVDQETSFSGWVQNRVIGVVGDMPNGNHNFRMAWETGYSLLVNESSTHCNYEQSDCYSVKTVPVIKGLSGHEGFTTGRQNLTISGHGFGTGNITATIDGKKCEITDFDHMSFSCEVAPSETTSDQGTPRAGLHGISKYLYSGTSIGTESLKKKMVWTDTQSHYSITTSQASEYKGWFVAPETANYRFYMSCDDTCSLKLGSENLDVDTAEALITVSSHSDWRDYYKHINSEGEYTQISRWVSLEKGKSYYLDATHTEHSGGDHFTLSVEIEKQASRRRLQEDEPEIGAPKEHHEPTWEVQKVGLQAETRFEKTKFTVSNVHDGGSYILIFWDANMNERTLSDRIAVNASASDFSKAVKSFYKQTVGCDVKVELTMYNSDRQAVTEAAEASKFEYEVELTKLILGFSVGNIQVSATGTTVEVVKPQSFIASLPPFTGQMRVKCVDFQNQVQYSELFSVNADSWRVERAIRLGCDKFVDRIQVKSLNTYGYYQNGRDFIFTFRGYDKDPGQFELELAEDNELHGFGGQTKVTETLRHYQAKNIFYEPIPFELLRTFETKPSVEVFVDGHPAVCQNLDCDFSYVDPVGEVTGFTFDELTSTVTLVGTSLPTALNEVREINFAKTTCSIDESTLQATGVSCKLDQTPTCGRYTPEYLAKRGLIPSSGLADVVIPCEVTEVFPDTPLNLLGGDNITFTGNKLPHTLKGNDVSIQFSDSQSTKCIPMESTSTKLVCLTQNFNVESSSGNSLNIIFSINGVSASVAVTMKLRTNVMGLASMSPSSVSPVLKTKITFQLDSSFDTTTYSFTKNDFSVNATSKKDSPYVRYLRVIEVDAAAKTLVAMFGGAHSGAFDLSLRHSSYGLLKTSDHPLAVGSKVTSVSRNTISPYGGTRLVIQGENFGKEITDNPVQISYNGGVGSTDCFLESSTPTEIICRVASGIDKTEVESATLVVFLKTSEEAECDSSTTCKITFAKSLPTISTSEIIFDDQKQKLRVTGTGFTGSSDSTLLTVEGRPQITSLFSSSGNMQTIEFTLSNITTNDLTGKAKLFFDIGVPAQHSLIEKSELKLTPQFVSITPNVGSLGGSVILASVEGVGTGMSGFTLKEDSKDICEKAEIISSGVLKCTTKADLQIAAGTVLSLEDETTTYECAGSQSSMCQYEQTPSATMPAVSAVAKANSKALSITGLAFNFDSSFVPKAMIGGVSASTVVIDSATSITATWDLGVPVLSAPTLPVIFFENSEGIVHYAKVDNGAFLSNPIAIASKSTGLECSFAGGCLFEIEAEGLSAAVKENPKGNKVAVCDAECLFDEGSDSSILKCAVPALSTAYSNEHFAIASETHNLDSGRYFGSGSNTSILFDEDIVKAYESSSDECFAGMEFKEGHVGMISQVKYFMGDIDDKLLYAGNLKFQGSSDNSTWNDLFGADINIHEGWNYFNWDEPADYPKYRFYRFFSTQSFGCNMREIQFRGVETINDNSPDYSCAVTLSVGGQVQSLTTMSYKAELTSVLSLVEPRYGTVEGGTSVTFTANKFPTDSSLIKVMIDGRECSVTGSTATTVTCTTADRPGLVKPSMSIFIDGQGYVSKNGVDFRYVSFWSAESTWGGEFAPMEMESVHIPEGLNLLVDIDSSPKLNAIVVEGGLIFSPEADSSHQRFFDAHYIFVNGGTMEVGTEKHPYTSQLAITMHSNASDPYLPIYGNKVIGLRFGTLDFHGVKRTTWTVLEQSATADDSEITVKGPIDWKVGEEIGIASTSYDGRMADKRMIKAIDNSNPLLPILTLDKPLQFDHVSTLDDYSSESGRSDDWIEMKAEVGLLSRNVKFRGDPETSEKNQYGANMFLHSEGDESLVARIENIELYQVGQAFKIGRYAIHFHMIGTVHQSYVKGISVHRSYNRMTTLHAIKYLTIDNNVGYDIMGHAIFMEDGVERKNMISNNLIMNVKRSMSLLNTDQTPACFWITNPDNAFVNNRAAGSDRYGYWYDLQIHAIGPSANTDICPENERAGENRDNHAHSVGRYGLRIFHNMVSREKPCEPVPKWDPSVPGDPYHKNRPITNNFYNFTGWKNGRNCAIAKDVSDIRFHNFKCSDNILAGSEISVTEHYNLGEPQIRGGIYVGKSPSNTDPLILEASPNGIITSRTENFAITGAHFFHYNWNNAAAFGTCSHCITLATRDDGARQHNTSSLFFGDSVTKRITYTIPWTAIFYDLDGTLTGKGPRTWTTKSWKHLEVQPECELNTEVFEGVVCDSTQRIRRVAFTKQVPDGVFFKEDIFVLPYDESIVGSMTPEELKAYESDWDNFGILEYQKMGSPGRDTVPPLLTGHKYKIHWSDVGIDFESMQVLPSQNFEVSDPPIYIIHNFTDQREVLNFTYNSFSGEQIMNNTLDTANWLTTGQHGQNLVLNDTATRRIHYIVSGSKKTYQMDIKPLWLKGLRCAGACLDAVEEGEVETSERFWSDAKNWPEEKLPAAGDSVEILSTWNMIYDIGESPIFDSLFINGKLSFKDDKDQTLNSKVIFVRAGELHIGSEDAPFQHEAKIVLHGDRNDKTLAFDNSIFGSNKVLANVGTIKMFGKKRDGYMTRLRKIANKGDNHILVEPWLELQPGDELVIATQGYTWEYWDDVKVKEYNPKTGMTFLEEPVQYYHWGQLRTTEDKYGFDIRGEVALLSRNIKIMGSPGNVQGGHIITADIVELTNDATNPVVDRQGQLIMDNVETYNCSQVDSENAAIRFEGAVARHSSVTNSTVHHGLGWGLKVWQSKNIHLEKNVFHYFTRIGATFDGVTNVTFNDNFVSRVKERVADEPRGGVLGCTMLRQECTDLHITNNIVAGACFGGFTSRGHSCGAEASQTLFRNNTAHSVKGSGGGYCVEIEVDPYDSQQRTCFAASHFNTYKCTHQGLASYQNSRKIHISHVNSLDNLEGFTAALHTGKDEYKDYVIEISDSSFYGESDIEDCPIRNGVKQAYCTKSQKLALINAQITENGKVVHEGVCVLPMYKQWSANSWNLRAIYNRNKFSYFTPETRTGKKQAAIGFNHLTWDVIFIHEFYDTEFLDVRDGSLAFLRAPPREWAALEICGNFPCSGPLNAIFSFKRSKWYGQKPVKAYRDFQIISNNDGISPYVPTCTKHTVMNAYICQQDKLGLLMFESLDHDRLSRASQPIYVKMQGTQINSKLNAFKDHNWDGFYNKQERLQRFPAIVYGPRGSIYDITYTGSPAQNQTYKLMGQSKTIGLTVRIAYPSAESRQIKKDGEYIPMNQWDEGIKNYGPIKQRFCGENRYIGVKNILEFYLNTGCEIRIHPRNAIQTLVRMEWTMEEFFADGGTTKFIDRLAGSLGIHASTIKVVSVYEGSLVVNYEIEATSPEEMASIEETQLKQFATNKVDLGAPLLDVAAGSIAIISDGVVSAPGYEPIVITMTDSNQGKDPEDTFNPVNVTTETENKTDTNVIKEEVIVNTTQSGPKVIYTTVDNTTSTIIITVAVMCLIFAIVIASFKYYSFQKEKDVIDAQIIHEKHLQYDRQNTNTKITMGGHAQLAQNEESFNSHRMSGVTDSNLKQVLGNQFDPSNDFVVFGVQNKQHGGILQEKQNEAELVERQFSGASQAQPQAQLNVPEQLESKPSPSSSEGRQSPNPLVDQALVKQGSVNPNHLDEEKEVVSSSDEEEGEEEEEGEQEQQEESV